MGDETALLEPQIHEGVDHDVLFTVRWNGF